MPRTKAKITSAALDGALRELRSRAEADAKRKAVAEAHHDKIAIIESFWSFQRQWEDRTTSELLRLRRQKVMGEERESVMSLIRKRPGFEDIKDFLQLHGFMHRVE